MRIQLSDHFTYNRLLRFVLPSITTMVFISIYSVVDGLFVSNFVGKTPFAAINLIMPVLMMLNAVGLMVGAGGSAIIGLTLGENKKELAGQYFSTLIYSLSAAGIILSAAGFLMMKPISAALGAEGEILEDCVLYGHIVIAALPFAMLQMAFQSFFITAEKPKLGLAVTITSGVSNMILDAVFILGFKWGLFGAAFATATSQALGATLALVYFARKNDSLLRLALRTKFYGSVLLKACANGASEMVSNIAASVISMLYNYQLMRLAGENGIAAFGVVMYVSFIFDAIFYGYSMGSSPVVSYHYGAANYVELRNLFKKSLVIMLFAGVLMLLSVTIAAAPLAALFVGYDKALYAMTVYAFRIFSMTYLFSGFTKFSSGFFTALNDGKISAIISFLRTFVFEIGAVIIMPELLGLDGVWWAIVVAEIAAFVVSVFFLMAKRSKYRYV